MSVFSSFLGAALGYFAARLADHVFGLEELAERIASLIHEVAPWLRLGEMDPGVNREVSL